METKFLLSNKFKPVGWLLFLGSALLWVYFSLLHPDGLPVLQMDVFTIAGSDFFGNGSRGRETVYFGLINTSITETLFGLLFILGGLLIVFSREKVEDEFIARLRLQSFQWSFMINYILLFLLFFFIHGMEFLFVMVYHMFTILILFICRFHYLLYKNKN